jgi:hypothetical protein
MSDLLLDSESHVAETRARSRMVIIRHCKPELGRTGQLGLGWPYSDASPVSIEIISDRTEIYSCSGAVWIKLSNEPNRLRSGFISSSPSFSPQPSTIRFPSV